MRRLDRALVVAAVTATTACGSSPQGWAPERVEAELEVARGADVRVELSALWAHRRSDRRVADPGLAGRFGQPSLEVPSVDRAAASPSSAAPKPLDVLVVLDSTVSTSAPSPNVRTATGGCDVALAELIDWTTAWVSGSRATFGVLVTDDGPGSCGALDELDATGRAHLDATGARLFSIGVGVADFAALDALAVAAGSPPHDSHCSSMLAPCRTYDVASEGDVSSVFDDIAESGRCEVAVPAELTAIGDVRFVSGSGGSFSLHPVSQPSGCGPDPAYYADAVAPPSAVSLCPEVCAWLKADADAVIEVDG